MRLSVRENITLPALASYARAGLVRRKAEAGAAREIAGALTVKAASIETRVATLSGGNQQKVVLGKWMALRPQVIVFDEPTQGVDVGAKAEIHQRIRRLADAGAAVMMISSDLEEIVAESDRVAVMHDGRITGVLDRASCTPEAIMTLAVAPSPMTRKDISVLLLLVLLCAVVAVGEPAVPQRGQPAERRPAGRHLRHLQHRRRHRHHHRRHRFVGRVYLRSARHPAVDDAGRVAVAGSGRAARRRRAGRTLGAGHGLLVTRLRLPPFIVTLCGLLLYRGAARYIADDSTKGFGSTAGFEWARALASGSVAGVPMPFVALCLVAVAAWVLLHRSVYGRHLFAIGHNEEAARYSGVRTTTVVAWAYVISGALAALSGIIIAFYTNSISPASHGNFYELYAIAAAVVGGCSLRGGEGSVLGIVIGAALLQVLRNLVNLLDIPGSLDFAVMGAVILIGAIADQLVARRAQRSGRD